jgi:phosphatidylcholine synthase
VPIRFVHPLRVRNLRILTMTLLILWSALAAAALWHGLAPGLWINVGLCLIAVYFFGIGLMPARGEPT